MLMDEKARQTCVQIAAEIHADLGDAAESEIEDAIQQWLESNLPRPEIPRHDMKAFAIELIRETKSTALRSGTKQALATFAKLVSEDDSELVMHGFVGDSMTRLVASYLLAQRRQID